MKRIDQVSINSHQKMAGEVDTMGSVSELSCNMEQHDAKCYRNSTFTLHDQVNAAVLHCCIVIFVANEADFLQIKPGFIRIIAIIDEYTQAPLQIAKIELGFQCLSNEACGLQLIRRIVLRELVEFLTQRFLHGACLLP